MAEHMPLVLQPRQYSISKMRTSITQPVTNAALR
jgi:hypothetical protein